MWTLPKKHLEGDRNHMGLWFVILAMLLGRPCDIEVAWTGVAEAVRLGVPLKHLLDHQLRSSIGIDRCRRSFFGDRQGLWHSVDGGR